MIALAWIIFAGVVVGVTLFALIVTKYYNDRNESEALPTWATVIGLTVALLCVFLIPVDIYSVSSTQDSSGKVILTPEEIQSRSDGIRILYYILYSAILVLSFGIIPFAYFYYEEADEEVTVAQRIWGGCKYTIFLIVIVTVILIIGLILYFVKPGDRPTSTANTKDWAEHLVKQPNFAEGAISFAIACLTLLGFTIWITYTAYGLSAFPIGIIKGRKHVGEEVSDLNDKLSETRQKKRAVESKYLGGKKMSKRDEATVNLLGRQEKILSRQGQRLESEQTGWRKVWSAMKPFFFLFGIAFLLLSFLLIISIMLTNIDKAVHSSNFCGSKCGFVLAYPEIFNPLDTLLTVLSKYFPMDYVLLGGIVVYIFFTTLSGIVRIDVRFLWVNLYKIRPRATPPQGMLMSAIFLMLAILALNMEITTFAPQYANFGSQKFYNATSEKWQPCSLVAPPGNCTMSQIGTFVNRISVRTSFFGYVFFFGTWIFLLTWLIGLVVAIVKGKPSNVQSRESDSDEDER